MHVRHAATECDRGATAAEFDVAVCFATPTPAACPPLWSVQRHCKDLCAGQFIYQLLHNLVWTASFMLNFPRAGKKGRSEKGKPGAPRQCTDGQEQGRRGRTELGIVFQVSCAIDHLFLSSSVTSAMTGNRSVGLF